MDVLYSENVVFRNELKINLFQRSEKKLQKVFYLFKTLYKVQCKGMNTPRLSMLQSKNPKPIHTS